MFRKKILTAALAVSLLMPVQAASADILGSASPSVVADQTAELLSSSGFNSLISLSEDGQKVLITANQSAINFLESSSLWQPNSELIKVVVDNSFSYQLLVNVVGGMSLSASCAGGFPAMSGNDIGVLVVAHCFAPNTFAGTTYTYNGQPIAYVNIDTVTQSDLAFAAVGTSSQGLTKLSGGVPQRIVGSHDADSSFVCFYQRSTGLSQCGSPLAAIAGQNGRDFTLSGPGFIYKHNTVIGTSECVPGDSGSPAVQQDGNSNKYAVGLISGRIQVGGAAYCTIANISNSTSVSDALIIGGIQ